jgi:hypothetical protein
MTGYLRAEERGRHYIRLSLAVAESIRRIIHLLNIFAGIIGTVVNQAAYAHRMNWCCIQRLCLCSGDGWMSRLSLDQGTCARRSEVGTTSSYPSPRRRASVGSSTCGATSSRRRAALRSSFGCCRWTWPSSMWSSPAHPSNCPDMRDR